MYAGFKRFEIQTSDPEVKIVGCIGGHYPAEQVPDEVYNELNAFFKSKVSI